MQHLPYLGAIAKSHYLRTYGRPTDKRPKPAPSRVRHRTPPHSIQVPTKSPCDPTDFLDATASATGSCLLQERAERAPPHAPAPAAIHSLALAPTPRAGSRCESTQDTRRQWVVAASLVAGRWVRKASPNPSPGPGLPHFLPASASADWLGPGSVSTQRRPEAPFM
jgi:hypothetical protein